MYYVSLSCILDTKSQSHIKRRPELGARDNLSHSLPLCAPHSLTYVHTSLCPVNSTNITFAMWSHRRQTVHSRQKNHIKWDSNVPKRVRHHEPTSFPLSICLPSRPCHRLGQLTQVVGRVWTGKGLGSHSTTHSKPLPCLQVLWVSVVLESGNRKWEM